MKKLSILLGIILVFTLICSAVVSAANVSSAIEQTWTATKTEIKTVVNNVVFPALDVILAIAFFVKLGAAYFDYRKHGQFEWAAPVILFACLLFTLTAPTYLWNMLNM